MLFSANCFSQGAAINTSGTAADPSAILDVSSSNSGILIPRLTTTERDAIQVPAEGLQIFNTSSKCLEFYVNNHWKQTSCDCGKVLVDSRDNNVYQTIQIGDQCWMKENLKYLPSVVGPETNSSITPYYYVYGYDGNDVNTAKAQFNYSTYGVLYNWQAAMAGSASSNSNPSGVQGVCPLNWHLPSDDEWKQLEMYLGLTQLQADAVGWRGTNNEGGKLKATTNWNSPNTAATNSSGFTALPGGYRDMSNTFSLLGIYDSWWSATEDGSIAWRRYLISYNATIFWVADDKGYGFSVRCIKN